MTRETRIGSPRSNLVLETVSSIRVLVGDKYYNLKFDDTQSQTKDGTPIESNFIVCDTITNYENGSLAYPGDGKVIFALYSGIFYTEGGIFYPFTFSENSDVNSSEDTSLFNDTVTFNGDPAFNVSINSLIQNLNAQYLDGHTAEDFVLKEDGVDTSLDEIHTNDRLFNYAEGTLEVPNIVTDNLTVDNLKSGSISSPIIIGFAENFKCEDVFINSKFNIIHGIPLLDRLYELFDKGDLQIEENIEFVNLAKQLLSPINSDYNFSEDSIYVLNEICSSNLLFSPINESLWKSVKTNSGITLYDKLLKYIYTGDLSEYNGEVYIMSVNSTSGINVGTTFTGVIDDSVEVKAIITGIDVSSGEVYVKTDYKSSSFDSATLLTDVKEYSSEGYTTVINVKYYESETEESLLADKRINHVVGYINEYDGEVSDNLWLKLTSNGGFIGLDKDKNPFLEIDSNGVASIKSLTKFASNRCVTVPIIQFTKSIDEANPVIVGMDPGLTEQSLTKLRSSTWWNTNQFNASLLIPNELVENFSPTVTVENTTVTDSWWASTLVKSQSQIYPDVTQYELTVITIHPEEYGSEMLNRRDPFMVTIYGHCKLN